MRMPRIIALRNVTLLACCAFSSELVACEQETMARFAALLKEGAEAAGRPAAAQLDHQMRKYHDVRFRQM